MMETNGNMMLPSLAPAPPRDPATVDAALRRADVPQRRMGYLLVGGALLLAAVFAVAGNLVGGPRGAAGTFAALFALLGGPALLYAGATTRHLKRLFCDGVAHEGTVNRLFYVRSGGSTSRTGEGPCPDPSGATLFIDVGYADAAGHLALTRVRVRSHAHLREGLEVVVLVDPKPQPIVGVVAPGELDGSLNLYVGEKGLPLVSIG